MGMKKYQEKPEGVLWSLLIKVFVLISISCISWKLVKYLGYILRDEELCLRVANNWE